MRKKIFLVLAVLLVNAMAVLAQQKISVSGKVLDKNGEPVAGASIVQKNAQVGTVTDIDGKYTIRVPEDAALEFIFMGFETQLQNVKGRKVINVTLAESAEMLEGAVVNVGYGSVRKSDLTGAVSSVVLSDLEEQSKGSFETMLQGRMSGVQVTSGDGTPGGGMAVKIRGAASVSASTEPLYVIDGFPYITEDTEQSAVMKGQTATASPLALINPNDIVSIEVLKDASSTAIYGSRAANGVVLITTKSGTEGKAKINYAGSFGVQQVSKQLEMLSQEEYLGIIDEIGNRPQTSQFFNPLTGMIRDELYDPKAYIDWQDLTFRLGHKTEHQLSVSGGTKAARYNVSMGVYDENGVAIESDFTRFSGRINLDFEIKKWLDAGVRSSVTYMKSSGPWSGGGINQFAGLTFKALKYRPINMNPDAEEFDPGDMIEGSENTSNPLVFAREIDRTKNHFANMANLYLNFKIAKGLTLRVTGGYNFNSVRNSTFFARRTDIGKMSNGMSDAGTIQSANISQEDVLTYSFKKKAHNFTGMIGFSYQGWRNRALHVNVKDFQSEINRGDDISMATQTFRKETQFNMFNNLSMFTRLSYNYDSRYYITASFRRDGSSKFGANNKWANFPSVALMWRPSREKFMEGAKSWLYNMKIRASYGLTGNQSIPSYQSLPLLGPGYIINGNSEGMGYIANSWGNPDLKWESTRQFDAGIDLELFKGRFNITYDFYQKSTYDMLLNMKIPAMSGYTNRLANVGAISQWGHELTISATPFNKAFRWEIGLNMSFEKNKVKQLAEGMTEMLVGLHHQVKPGMPLGAFYGWEADGLYQPEDFDPDTHKLKEGVPFVNGFQATQKPGDMKFKDISGAEGVPDGVVNEYDKTVIGNANPDFYGGFTNNFRYKNFELKIFMNFVVGNDIYNINMENFGVPRIDMSINYFKRVANHWTPDNMDTDVPRLCPGGGDRATHMNSSTDYFLEDGSFLRLSNISLGYNIPKDVLRKAGMSGVKIYFSVDNAWVFTKYSGYDPEVNIHSNPLTPGLDSNPYPRARVYKLGLNLNF